MNRPKVVRVTAADKAALVAAATKEREQQTAAPSCERVLVVYGLPRLRSGQAQAANLYIESTPARGVVARRRTA